MDVPENAPSHCPGTDSNRAGQAEPCQGCPNRQICASGGAKATDDPALDEISQRMASVKHKVLVLSGKGGVGKSTFSVCLARALSENNEQSQVALLDVDICGPSQPKMLGVEGEQVHQSLSGWSPIFAQDNLCLMSVGFLLGSLDEAVIWRGPKKNGLIKQFLKDVDWGDIDYMIIDTPPGTSDEHLSIVQFLMNTTNVDGAVLVTTPQEIALQDVRKEANFCRKVKLPIIGVVENMSSFVCPKCKGVSSLFAPSTGGALAFCQQMQVAYLGSIPLDPRLAQCCDEGSSFLELYNDSPAAKSIKDVANKIVDYCEKV